MEEAIKTYLEKYAQEDIDFSLFYPHATKTILGCCKYIENHYKKQAEEQAKASHEKDGSTEVVICKPVERSEVFAMAVRYFEDDTIEEFKEEEKPAGKAKKNG